MRVGEEDELEDVDEKGDDKELLGGSKVVELKPPGSASVMVRAPAPPSATESSVSTLSIEPRSTSTSEPVASALDPERTTSTTSSTTASNEPQGKEPEDSATLVERHDDNNNNHEMNDHLEADEITPEPIDQGKVGRLLGFEMGDVVGVEGEVDRNSGDGEDEEVRLGGGMEVDGEVDVGGGKTGREEEVGGRGLEDEGLLRIGPDDREKERQMTEAKGGEAVTKPEEMEREPEEKVDMSRLLNSIEITKRATFLRQRLSSVGRRPSGETLRVAMGPGPMEGLSNPFSSPPSSPPRPRTPGGRIKKDLSGAGSWRQPVGMDSPYVCPPSPVVRLYPGSLTVASASASGSGSGSGVRPGGATPKIPMTPVKKRKLDYMDSPFRSPGDLMALTLESPGKGKGDEMDFDMDHQQEVKRRGKTWVTGGSPAMLQLGPGQHGRTTSFSAAKVLFSNSNDSMVRIGRRASMGTGPRLGFALPRKDRAVVDTLPVDVAEHERAMPPRRVMGIEGYLVDRYSDVLGRSKYPPPLPISAAPALALAKPKPMFELGHRPRRISASSTSKPAMAVRGHEKYVSFLGGKKPRSSSHSLATGHRPSGLNPNPSPNPTSSGRGGPGEVAEAANVLTGMLGNSPLRRSTASPVRPPKAGKMYGRDGEELGFRIPSTRPGGGGAGGGGRPRSESTERRMEMLPPIISGEVTPPRQISKLPHLRHTDGKPVVAGEATRDDDQRAAAELMIFLAQSPGSTASGSREKRSFVQATGVGRVLFDQRDEAGVVRDTGGVAEVKLETGSTAI